MTNFKYDGEHYQVTLMNMRDGSVQGHRAGCADLKRGVRKYAEPSQADDVWDVKTKADAWMSYNSDFLAEGGEENAYSIEWLPCTKHIAEGDTHEAYVAEFGEDEVPLEDVASAVERSQDVTVKRGRKWSYIYRGEELLAEVRNDAVEAVIAALQA